MGRENYFSKAPSLYIIIYDRFILHRLRRSEKQFVSDILYVYYYRKHGGCSVKMCRSMYNLLEKNCPAKYYFSPSTAARTHKLHTT